MGEGDGQDGVVWHTRDLAVARGPDVKAVHHAVGRAAEGNVGTSHGFMRKA